MTAADGGPTGGTQGNQNQPSGGTAGTPQSGGSSVPSWFNWEAYLNAYSDVKANSFFSKNAENAYQHFYTYGAKEGRNPNPVPAGSDEPDEPAAPPAVVGEEGDAGPNYGQQGAMPGSYMSPNKRFNTTVRTNQFYKPQTQGQINAASNPPPQTQTNSVGGNTNNNQQPQNPNTNSPPPMDLSSYQDLYQFMIGQGYGENICSNVVRGLGMSIMKFTQPRNYFL